MTITIIVRTNGNKTSVTFKRSSSFRIEHIATSDLEAYLRSAISALRKAGYTVTVQRPEQDRCGN